MGLIHFQPARRTSEFEVADFALKSDAAFKRGAPVKRNATATQILEFGGGTDVTGLLGFAMGGALAGLPAAKGTYAYGTTVAVAMANEETEYMGQLISAVNGTIVTPAASNVRTYGIVKNTSGDNTDEWFIDVSETTSLILTVTRIFPEIKAVLFKLIPTVIGS